MYVDFLIMIVVVMVVESRIIVIKIIVVMMMLELELDVVILFEKKEIIINIYFKILNGEYILSVYKKLKRNCNCLYD